jgi:hypothetical protein
VNKSWMVGALLLAACGGGQTSTAAPSPGPEYAVQEFMAAVADSNLPKIAEYWGTAKGSAAETGNPSDYPKRIEVIQLWLRGHSYRIVGSTPTDATRVAQEMQVELAKGDCRKQVAFLAVKTGSSRWVIQSIDLNAVGSPAQPCIEEVGAAPGAQGTSSG